MAKIEKIYQITLDGEQELLQKMNAVNKSFDVQKKLFQEVKSASKGLFGNSEELAREKIELEKVSAELVRQQTESKKLRAESIALANAKKALSNEELKNQQATMKTYEAYQKLSRQYSEAKKNALGIGATYGVNSVQFQKASAEAQKYYQQMTALNKAVGDFKLNVGNYPTAAVRNFAETFNQNFRDMKGQMASFALGYISFQGALNAGTRIKNDVIAFDSLNKSIEAVSEKTGDYALNQQFLAETSERLGQKTLDYSKSFKSFFAAFTESGGGAQEARDIYEAAAESSANLRLSQEQTNGVMLAFGQIASKGKVQAEELRGQIGERIPGAFGIAARAMGMTTAELDKVMSKGELYSKDFLPKFAKELKKTFGTGGEAVTGLQADLNRLDNMIAKIGSNKKFIAAVSATVSAISILVTLIGKIPFSVWLSFMGLLTLAYWANIQAIVAKNAQIAVWIVRMGVGNALIATATALERAHALVIFLVNGAYNVLILTMNLFGVSTVRLRAFIVGLNITLAATPWGIILGLILAVGAATVAFANKTEAATGKLKAHGQQLKDNATIMRANAEINKQVSDTISGQMGKIERLTAIIKNNNISLETKKRALQELIAINPKYLEGLTLENMKTAEGTKILDTYKNKLLEVSKAKAAIAIYDRKAAELFELETSLNDKKNAKAEADKYKNNIFDRRSWGEFGKGLGGILGMGEGDSEDKLNKTVNDISRLKKELNAIGDIIVGNSKRGINPDDPILGGAAAGNAEANANSIKRLREEIAALTIEFENATIGTKNYYDLQARLKAKQAELDRLLGKGGSKSKTYRGSRLTGNQRDYLKDLEADRDKELAIIEAKFLKGEILEEEYIRKSLAENQKFFNKKIAYLKGGNAEERKQEARAILDKIKMESDANDKLYALFKKRYDQELKLAEDTAKDKLNKVLNDPYSTELEKINAQKKFHEESTTAQIIYNQKMIDLENDLSKKMINEAEERSSVLQQKLNEENQNNLRTRIDTTRAMMVLIDEGAEYLENQIQINDAIARRNILQDKTLKMAQKKIDLERLAAKLELANTNTELGLVNAKIAVYDIELNNRKLTNDELREYNRLLKERAILEGNKSLQETNLQRSGYSPGMPGSGTSGIANFFKERMQNSDGVFNIGTDKDGASVDGSELLGEVLAQSFDTATLAMNNYFDAERNRIEQSKQLAYSRIDLEREQQMRYAQSSDERAAIDKEAAQKKKNADKEAGERLKKVKKQELKMALAMQLANIGVAAAQNPLNGVTFGAAGIAMYAALAAIAFGQYFMNLSAVNSMQYKKGGQFLGQGGQLRGPSHSNGGMPVYNPQTGQKVAEMEGKEGIINAKSMEDKNIYSVTGTPSQIASRLNAEGGGVDWFGGATMKKFASGGIFNWNRTQPPVFKSQVSNFEENPESFNSDRLNRIEENMEALSREGFKKVVLNPNEVTSYQNEKRKQTEIGTL